MANTNMSELNSKAGVGARANNMQAVSEFSGFADMTDAGRNYAEYRHCEADNNMYKTYIYFGLNETDGSCTDNIIWYQAGVDFQITDKEGKMEVNTDDIDETGHAYQRQAVSNITHERSFTIRPNLNSTLVQKLLEIEVRDGIEGREGELILEYAQSGAHWKIVLEAPTFTLTQYAFDCTFPNWGDVMFNNSTASDAELELNANIQWGMVYEMEGTIPTDFGIPAGVQEITIVRGSKEYSSGQLTITGMSINDPDGFLGENPTVVVQLIDPATKLILETKQADSTGTVIFNETEEEDFTLGLDIKYGWLFGGFYRFEADVEHYVPEVTPARTLKKAVKKTEEK